METHSKAPNLLLTLPLELRINIYRHLLVSSYDSDLQLFSCDFKTPTIHLLRHQPNQFNQHTGITIAILTTGKQISVEAATVLYASNAFRFEGCDHMAQWISIIGPHNAKNIRCASIYASLPSLAFEKLEKCLQSCTGIKKLYIYSHMMSCCPPRRPQGVKRFLEAVKPILDNHESLTKIMSKYNGGYQRQQVSTNIYPKYWDALSVTLVASVDDGDPGKDGIPFDIQEAIEDIWSEKFDDNDSPIKPPPKT